LQVVIVDKNSEIAGYGDAPHESVGLFARRLTVCKDQGETLVEAVENHSPEVIVVDEISTKAVADACRSIAERGVRLIATAHGTSVSNVVQNPVLRDVLGGVETATLSDHEAASRGCRKTILERREPPAFEYVYELGTRRLVDTREEVDELLKRSNTTH